MSEKAKPQPAAGTASAQAAGTLTPAKPKPDEKYDFLRPAQQPGELGRLAHYRVLKVLGKGGMGIVFQAEDTRLNRIVGLKVMLPSMAKKQLAHDRFIREARATAAIEHDHIVTIYDVNEDKGVPYLAMQYLKGATLEDFLKRGKGLNVPQILRIGKEIAKGLAAAHACKHIHRDIKPSNIWLDSTNKGRVKILDFGLARPTNAETHLTQEGLVLGSPAYMAPEQAFGQPIDGRCDLFSLGCVLYRLCAGKLPFMGKDPTSVLLAITSTEPAPLSEINPELPRGLIELVHQLLAKKPEDRPASAKAVVQRLQDLERDWVAQSKTLTMPTLRPTLTPAKAVADEYDVEPVPDESAIMDLETPSEPPAPRQPGRARWLIAALCGSLISILSVFCCLGIAIASDHGFVKIEAVDDQARTFLEQTGLTALDHHQNPHVLKEGTHQLPTGGYDIDLTSLPAGALIDPPRFTLHWRDTVEIKLRLKRPRPVIIAYSSEQAKKVQQDWAEYLNVPAALTLPGDVRLVLIPPGEFEMGSARQALVQQIEGFKKRFKLDALLQNNAALLSESPRHGVRITRPFYLGEYEITFLQFSQFVSANNYHTAPEQDRKGGTGIEKGTLVTQHKPAFTWKAPGFAQKPDQPVCDIAWKDAEAFCAWLSKKTGRVCRLPTEAEWELACRAGTSTPWSFGDDPKYKDQAEHMWCLPPLGKKVAIAGTHPVGRKRPNPLGLFDMHGNVEEMCKDFWTPDYYERNSPKTDPQGPPPSAKVTQRVARGGSFAEIAFLCRSASRSPRDPHVGDVRVGFRIVCEIPPPRD